MRLITIMAAMAAALYATTTLASPTSPSIGENLVRNGGFETGDFTGWDTHYQFQVFTNTDISGGGKYEATEFGDLAQHTDLSQVLNLEAGSPYLLSFKYSGGIGYDPAAAQFKVGDLTSNVLSSGGANTYKQGFIANGNNAFTINGVGINQHINFDNFSVNKLSLASIIQNSVKVIADKSRIVAYFKPNFGLSLPQVAKAFGFTNFNWTQTLTKTDSPLKQYDGAGGLLNPPFLDPPSSAYPYLYEDYPGYKSSSPYYYRNQNDSNPATNLDTYELSDDTELAFSDSPSNACFSAVAIYTPGCHGVTSSGATYFTTDLVGVRADGTSQKLDEFTWKSNFGVNPIDDAACLALDLSANICQTLGSGDITLNTYLPFDVQLPGQGGVDILSQKTLVASVPESTTWTMEILGLGLVGGALRLRQRQRLLDKKNSPEGLLVV